MENERPISCPIYEKDLAKVKNWRDRSGFKNLAETMRVIIEYADAHKVFT